MTTFLKIFKRFFSRFIRIYCRPIVIQIENIRMVMCKRSILLVYYHFQGFLIPQCPIIVHTRYLHQVLSGNQIVLGVLNALISFSSMMQGWRKDVASDAPAQGSVQMWGPTRRGWEKKKLKISWRQKKRSSKEGFALEQRAAHKK